MRESPAKSSSSANDFKRYSCCPIPHVYHALFRPRKMPIAPFPAEKPARPRLAPRSFDPAQTKRPRTQIFALLAFTHHRPSDHPSSKYGGRRLASTKYRGRFRGVRRSPSTAITSACIRARTPRKRTHTQPVPSSPVAQTFPRLRPQNHLPPHAAPNVSRRTAQPTWRSPRFVDTETGAMARIKAKSLAEESRTRH